MDKLHRLQQIDTQAKELGVFIITSWQGGKWLCVTAMDHPIDGSRIVISVSRDNNSQLQAIFNGWETGLPFYQKVKDADSETLANIVS